MIRNNRLAIGAVLLIALAANAEPLWWTRIKSSCTEQQQAVHKYISDSTRQQQALGAGLVVGGTLTSLWALLHRPQPIVKVLGMHFKNRLFTFQRVARVASMGMGIGAFAHGHTKLREHNRPYAQSMSRWMKNSKS